MQKDLKILFVVNPIAGGKHKGEWETAIREFLKDAPYGTSFFTQTGKNDDVAMRREIELFRPEIVVAVGGDGTVKQVAEIVQETEIRLGILPAGSANGLAKELDIPDDVNEALRTILEGECKKLDAIKINDRELCFHLSDVGLNALLVKYFEASETRGFWGYGKSLFKMLWNKRRMRVTIQTDSGEVQRKAYMVVLANAEKYGTGAVINPEGNVSDGCFEIVVVRKLHLVEIIKAITARKTFHPKRIEVLRTKKAQLQLERKAPFQVDGEYLGKTASIKAHIVPGVINVMMPTHSSTSNKKEVEVRKSA